MKVLLYFENEKILSKSGIGRALQHQMKALEQEGIAYTLDPNDSYDIMHINTFGPKSLFQMKKCRKLGRKIVYHAHSTEEDFRNSFLFSNQLAPYFRKWLVHLYTKADHIITPTPYAKRLLEGYGIQLPITAISNGINLDKFSYRKSYIKEFRQYFNLCNYQKVIISVGLFFERKGILDFIEVAKQLPQYLFIWFGHVPLYSVPRKIRRIVRKDHPANVIFPGYMTGNILKGAFCGADAFFFPSKEETEGIVVLEALASYQQVILRDIPVFEPWMKDKVNCYKGNSVADFVHLVEAVVEHQLPDVSQEGHKTAEQRSLTVIGKQLHMVYDACCSLK